jgi:hypothetical protein
MQPESIVGRKKEGILKAMMKRVTEKHTKDLAKNMYKRNHERAGEMGQGNEAEVGRGATTVYK